MKKLLYLLIISLLSISLSELGAQQATAGNDAPKTYNYQEIVRQKGERWKNKAPQKGDGFKQFKRWEHFWHARLMPDGSFPDPEHNTREWLNYQEKQPEARTSSALSANWTNLGPNTSAGGYNGVGRINCIAFHPNNSNIIFVGAPAGGLWKSTNGGNTWLPITDNLVATLTIGISSIAIDPSNPNIMYIATGDKAIGNYFPFSVGVLKSVDGGNTWSATGQFPGISSLYIVNKVVVHPSLTNILFAATSQGLFRSENSGASWESVVDGEYCYDIEFKPGSSSLMYLATRDKFFRSTNRGESWNNIGSLQGSGRMEIAVTPSNPSLVALVSSDRVEGGGFFGYFSSTNSGGSFDRKDDGTKNLLVSTPFGDGLGGQGIYDLCITVSPTDPQTIYIGGVNLWKSSNGGRSWNLINYWSPGNNNPGVTVIHADKHALEWQDNNTLFQGNDGGIYKSTNGGAAWTDLSNSLEISQIYRIGVSQADDKVIAGLQDNSTKLKNSNGGWIDFFSTGDGMENFIHPTNPNIIYWESYFGQLYRTQSGSAANGEEITPQQAGAGAWVTPWVMDPNNTSTLYAGYTDVWKSTNQGSSWFPISSNLTSSGGKLKSLAVAPSNSSTIYTASDKNIWRTTNGGNSWNNIRTGLPITNDGIFIRYITVDLDDASILYITLSGYAENQKVYKSTNGGNSWTNFSGSLPNVPANCLTIQPGGNEALYVGTDLGVYFRDASMSDWVSFNNGLPPMIVSELECKASSSKIIAATFGRGLWQSDYFSNEGNNNALSISPTTRNINARAGTTTFNISTTLDWTISENDRWVDLSSTSGSGSATINASYEANTSRNQREAILSVNAGTHNASAKIVQAGTGTGGVVCRPPSNLRVSQISQTSARLSWSAVSGAISFTVRIRILPNGNWVDTNPSTFTSTSIVLHGLAPGTTYEWRVKTNCADDQTSTLANGDNFSTDAAPTCNRPTGLEATNVTQNSAVVSWSPVSGASHYILQTRKAPNGTWANTNPATFISTSVSLSGLSPNTAYHWRIRAHCDNNHTSDWSNIGSFTTLPAPVCHTPGNLQSSNITASSVVASWGPVSGGANYAVQIRVHPNGNWVNLDPPTFTTTSVTITNLAANTSFQWRVRANCSNGVSSNWSTGVLFTTLPLPTCSIPGNRQSTNITQNGLVVSWNAVSGAANYHLQTRLAPNGQWFDTNPSTFTSTSVTVSGLNPNTAYQWRVKTNCSNGVSSNWSSPSSFTTLPALVCNSPTDLSTTSIIQNTALLHWGAVSGAASYTLQFNSTNGWVNWGGGTITGTSLSLYGFWPNQYYEWRVIANCSNGLQSLPSGTAWFYTATTPTCHGWFLFPSFALTPLTSWRYQALFGGNYSVMNVTAGNIYEFSTCASDNGFVAFDAELYVRAADGTTIAYADNSCGLAPRIVWQAGFTGQVQVLLTRKACQAQQANSTLAYRRSNGFVGDDEPLEERSQLEEEPQLFTLEEARVIAQNQAVGPENAPSDIELTVFPNPSWGQFSIQWNNTRKATSTRLFIYDYSGNVVWQQSQNSSSGLNTKEVVADRWPSGIYIVRLLTDDGRQATHKLLIGK